MWWLIGAALLVNGQVRVAVLPYNSQETCERDIPKIIAEMDKIKAVVLRRSIVCSKVEENDNPS